MTAPRIFFTSDPHMFHDKVARLRGFDDPADWQAFFTERWNDVVRHQDQVWILGDLTGGGHLSEALALMGSLPGEKHLILGNHDQAHPMHRDSHRKLRHYAEVFASVQLHAQRRIAGREVLVSHFPYRGDTPGRQEDRFTQWRLPDQGRPLLHGHTHSPLVRLNCDNVISVGWDAWHRLVPTDEIEALLV